jgi:hypothetical protein
VAEASILLRAPIYIIYDMIYIYIYIYTYVYLTAIGLTPSGSSTAHIYAQTINIIQRKEYIQ